MKGTHSHSSKDSANHKHGNVLCTGKDDGGDHEQRTAVPVPQNKKAMSANIVLHVWSWQFLYRDGIVPQDGNAPQDM